MIALLTYPTSIESPAFQNRTENDSFSHRVWALHCVIADPASEAGDVKNAKLSLLRTLTKSRVFERSVARCKRVLDLSEHSIMPLRDPLIDRSCFK